jgi:hypothetical protein
LVEEEMTRTQKPVLVADWSIVVSHVDHALVFRAVVAAFIPACAIDPLWEFQTHVGHGYPVALTIFRLRS